jgi:hypothetical protein
MPIQDDTQNIYRHFLGSPAVSYDWIYSYNPTIQTVLIVSLLSIGVVLAIFAILSIFISNSFPLVRFAWVLIILGVVGIIVAEKTPVAYTNTIIYAWPGAFVALILLGELICLLTLESSKPLKPFIICLVGISMVANLGFSVFLFKKGNVLLTVQNSAFVPSVGVQMQNLPAHAKVLAIKPVGEQMGKQTAKYEVLRKQNSDFIDLSAAITVDSLNGPQNVDISELVGELITNPSQNTMQKLSFAGIGGVLLPENTNNEPSYSTISAAINSTPNIKKVIDTQKMQYWRVDAKIASDLTDYHRALTSPKKILWVTALFIFFIYYGLLALPVIRRKFTTSNTIIKKKPVVENEQYVQQRLDIRSSKVERL